MPPPRNKYLLSGGVRKPTQLNRHRQRHGMFYLDADGPKEKSPTPSPDVGHSTAGDDSNSPVGATATEVFQDINVLGGIEKVLKHCHILSG